MNRRTGGKRTGEAANRRAGEKMNRRNGEPERGSRGALARVMAI